MFLVLAQARWLAIIVLRRDSATSITDEVIQWAILPSYARTCGIQTTVPGPTDVRHGGWFPKYGNGYD